MRIRNLFRFIPMLGLFAALAGCGGSVYTIPANIASPAAPGVREEVLRLVNLERKKRGLQPLGFSKELQDSAQSHADHMAFNDCYAHSCPGEPELSERIQQAGYKGHPGGENIHTGQIDPARVVQGWMHSKGHRDNIMKPGYTEAAVGHGYNPQDDGKHPYYHYWVLNFGFGAPQASQGGKPASGAAGEFAARTIALINAERTKRGLKPLAVDARLNRAAQFHVEYMASRDCYEHECQGGPTVADRLDRHGFLGQGFAENIAAGYATPEEAAVGWMNSPGHRENILTPEFTEVGAGYVFLPNDGGREKWGHYWAMNFGIAVAGYAPTTGAGAGAAPDEAAVATVIGLINDKRAARDLPPLTVDGRLSEAARRQAEYVGTRTCADGVCPGETGIGERLAQVNYRFAAAASQSSYGLMKPQEVAERLAGNGDGVLLGARYSDIGAGYYFDPAETGEQGYRLYWVVYVAAPQGSHSAAPATPRILAFGK